MGLTPPPSMFLSGERFSGSYGGRRRTPHGWPAIVNTLEREQDRLEILLAKIGSGAVRSPLDEAERFNLVLGVTCHAVYHTGQVQLIKVLGA